MVESHWDDWFVSRAIEGQTPDGMSVWYLGGNGFVVRTATTTVYLDPYFGAGNPPFVFRMAPVPLHPEDVSLCDAVLVTHEHDDHFHPPSYAPLLDAGDASLYATQSVFDDPDYQGELRAPPAVREPVTPGETLTVGDLSVHVRAANDPNAANPVAYVVESDDGVFFNGGDTFPGETLDSIGQEFDIDLGALAMGSSGRIRFPDESATRPVSWYMDENEVVEAANQLELDRLVPCHYDLWKGLRADPNALADHVRSYPSPETLSIVEVGDRIDVGRPGIHTPIDSLE